MEAYFQWDLPKRQQIEIQRRDQMSLVLKAGSERALLNRFLIELHKLDSDVLVGHNISGFDLDVLLHRAQACRVPSNMWSKLGRLKRSVMPKLTKGNTTFGSGASPGIMSCIAGRLLCDTFLCARDLLKEVSYSLTQLAKTQLNKDRKEIAPRDIPRMFQNSGSLLELIEYGETDAWLSMELMFHLSVLPLTRQLTNISGNLWGKTLQGARAQRVEYLLLHAFHAKKFIVPDKFSSQLKVLKVTKRKLNHDAEDKAIDDLDVDDAEIESPHNEQEKTRKGPAYSGGLVLEPKRGLYDKYILLLDFNSLYPSIIQEYNICFTTVQRSPDGSVPRLPSNKRPGLLPELLKNLVERRRMVKSWLKTASGLKVQQLDIQQQALKLTANRFYAKPLAELITLHLLKNLVERRRMVKSWLKTASGLKVQQLDIQQQALKLTANRFYAKPLAELITLHGWEILQSTVDLVQNNLNLEVQEDMRNGQVPLEKYVITKSLTKQPEAYPDAKSQPHVEVALRLKKSGYVTGCSAGDTVPYIISCEQGNGSSSSTGIAQRARHPDELKTDNGKWIIDIEYYLAQQIHPVVSRLCASIQGTSPARLADCLGLDSSKFQSKSSEAVNNDPSILLLCAVDDEERYRGCEPLVVSCPSCSGTFDCPPVFSSVCLSISGKPTDAQAGGSTSNFWCNLHCPKCPEEGEGGRISPVLIANQQEIQRENVVA
ncbi:unnamed protein product [Ilex paraguariensis]|uniref:DNA-directed DNA polymerase n=1 Tax=Ilex paraguariensis TaxID=185542 RepID=A0ABC8U736_9AQUA